MKTGEDDEMANERCLLVDANSLVHQVAFVNGDVRTVLASYIMRIRAQYIIVVFDGDRREGCWRTALFSGYKDRPEKKPEDKIKIQTQSALLKEWLDSHGIYHFSIPGVEADDAIGTLATRIQKYMFVDILSKDKDMLQLVTPIISQHIHGKNYRRVASCDVESDIGVPPWQVVDLKAMVGDPSDGYKGIKGVAEKTAIPLLQQYGSADRIFQALDRGELPQKVAKKLAAGREDFHLCRRLATIDRKVRSPLLKIDRESCRTPLVLISPSYATFAA